MSNFAEKLKKLRKEKGFTQEFIAEYLGLSGKAAVSNWENQISEPDGIDIYLKLSKLFNVSLDDLIKGKSDNKVVKENHIKYAPVDSEFQEIKRGVEFPILADVPAGRSEINHHDWPEYIKIDIDPREHFALRIDEEYGISMAPYIEPGDILFCSFTKKFRSGDIVVARYDGTKGAVKRIFINEQITLISFNPVESPIIINKKQLQQVFKVVLIWKRK